MGMRWMLGWALPLVTLGASAPPSTPGATPSTPETPQRVALAYQKPDCDPEKELKCMCVGSVGSAAAALKEVGVDAEVVRTSGAPCIRGDFDHDGEPDYAFPGADYASCNGSAPVRVIFTKGGFVREVQELPRRMSCFQLYRPHKKPGRNGVPATKRDALVDWGEGNSTWLFLYDGKKWRASDYASEPF